MKDLFGRDQDRSPGMAVSRRRALLALGVTAAGIIVIPQWQRLARPRRVVDCAALAKAMLPFSRDERAKIGRAVLSSDVRRDYVRELARCLGKLVLIRGTDLIGPGDLDRLVEPLLRRSREDFGDGRVLMVDRWYLSRTQCDVLAMAARGSGSEDSIGAGS